jgi:hypothetical protein
MASVLFGNKIDMLIAATPSAGSYIIGYDLDGILKQKDEFGIISPITINIGATGGISFIGPDVSLDIDSLDLKTASSVNDIFHYYDITEATNKKTTLSAFAVSLSNTNTLDNYQKWRLKSNGPFSTDINKLDTVSIIGGDGLSANLASKTVTIDVNLELNSGLTFSGNNITTELNPDSLEIDSNNQIGLKYIIEGNRQFTDSVIIQGNLIISGTSTLINTQELEVNDNIITLNANFTGIPFLDSGIKVERGDEDYSRLIWNEAQDVWTAGLTGNEQAFVLYSGTGLTKSQYDSSISLDFGIFGTGLSYSNNEIYSLGVQGSGTEDYIPKWSSDGDLIDSLVISGLTGIGIGTQSTTYKLNISGTTGNLIYDGDSIRSQYRASELMIRTNKEGIGSLSVAQEGGTYSPIIGLYLQGEETPNNVNNRQYGVARDVALAAGTHADNLNIFNTSGGTVSTGNIRLYAGSSGVLTNNTPTIHLQGSGATKGFVGIGTDSPIRKLDINNASSVSLNLRDTTITSGGWDRSGLQMTKNTSSGEKDFVRMGIVGNTDSLNHYYISMSGETSSEPWNDTAFRIYPNNDAAFQGKLNIGTASILTHTLNVVTDAISSFETIAKFSVSDNLNSSLRIENGTTVDDRFIPLIIGEQDSSFTALGLQGRGILDTGTSSVVSFGARIGGTASVVNRPLFTWNNYTTEVMRINANGNVGIGISTPNRKLHVLNNIRVQQEGANVDLSATNYHSGMFLSSNLQYGGDGDPTSSDNVSYITAVGPTNKGGTLLFQQSNNSTNRGLYFYTAPDSTGIGDPATLTEEFSVNLSRAFLNRNLGINTNVPGAVLDIKARDILSTHLPLRVLNSAGTIDMLKVRGDGVLEVITPSIANEELLAKFSISDNTGSSIEIRNTTTTGGVFQPGLIGNQDTTRIALGLQGRIGEDTGTLPVVSFNARIGATASVVTRPLFTWVNYQTEVMRINANGNVGIGTNEPTKPLDVNGEARIRTISLDNVLENILVSDANGVIHRRDASTIVGSGGGTPSLSTVLTEGNTTGANDIEITTGQKIFNSQTAGPVTITNELDFNTIPGKLRILSNNSDTSDNCFIDLTSGHTISLNSDNSIVTISNTFSVAGGTSSFKGIEYTADYSANFVPRSLVDKEYVDSLIDVVGTDTGTSISFTTRTIYNTHTSPATTNISNVLTGAKLGIIQKLYHNHSVAPTVPAGWVLMGDGIYFTNQLNVIYAEWCGGTRVEYWIIQEQ